MEFNTTTGIPNMTNDLPFDEIGIAISATFILMFLVVGVIANGLTIAVIITYPNLHKNIFLNFILSLCFSDLISALISWLFLYRRTWGFDYWDLPDFLCKIYWAFDIFTSFVTASHILSFSLLRLLSIQHTSFFREIKLRHGRLWILGLWMLCFAAGLIPSLFIFGSSGTPDRATMLQSARWPACTALPEKLDSYKHFVLITYPVFLLLPLVGVFITCAVIVWLVYSRSRLPINLRKSRSGKEKQAVLQLLLIIASFFVGYIPFTAYEMWSLQSHPNTPNIHYADYWFGMVEYIFLRFSECLNPIFYNFGSAKVRYHTKKFIMEKLLCQKRKIRTSYAIKRKTMTSTGVGFPKSDHSIKQTQQTAYSQSNSIALM